MNMPLMIDLSNKKVVIVGGGKVATRRAKTLLAYTKHIHVVSPTITDTLQKYLETKQSLMKRNTSNHKMLRMLMWSSRLLINLMLTTMWGQLCLRTYYLIMQDKQT